MLTRTHKKNPTIVSPLRIASFLLIFLLFAITAGAQVSNNKKLPAWQSYKGVTLGMTADQVREKLGAPKSEDEGGFFYLFSDTENAQFLLDANKKVRTISAVFSAEHTACPAFTDVFGKIDEMPTKPDGSIYKMVRYPEAGYWVSFSRTAGTQAMVIVMIQKM